MTDIIIHGTRFTEVTDPRIDFHREVAARVLNIAPGDVTPEQCRQAKALTLSALHSGKPKQFEFYPYPGLYGSALGTGDD